jgi:eukaryotic-like serine/threonine-protein kinase
MEKGVFSPVRNHAVSHDVVVGQILDHYRIVEKIGTGGMSEVYRAHDERLDRDVAIKVLPTGVLNEEAARKRFRKEALALSKLNHPNIATIHDFDTQGSLDFLVMEYIPGITLSEKVAKGSLPDRELLTLGTQLADGLSAAHEHGIIHRDLKPSNLRVTGDGRLKILDFGLAKLRIAVTATAITESISETHAMLGTLPYMAPEQLLDEEVDARTDIYAAGTVLYEMATGERPFAQLESSQLIGAILRRSPVPPTKLNRRGSADLDRIIDKCLEKDPAKRYQSAKELAVDLRRVGQPQTEPAQELKPRSSTRLLLTVAALFAVATAIWSYWTWQQRSSALRQRSKVMLVVLPFENHSGDPAQDYFGDGLTEEMIAQLGRLSPKHLGVIARTSAMRYKHTDKAIAQVGKELRVEYVLEGSSWQVGDRVHITAELIHVTDQTQLWSSTYDRRVADVLAVQNAVALSIAEALAVELLPDERAALKKELSVNAQAHEAYLRGRFHWGRLTGPELEKAREYFEQAVTLDPKYPPAYIGLADYYRATYSLPPKIAMAKAMEYVQKALALDNTLPEAHLALAGIEYSDWNWSEAEQQFKWALKLNPSYAEAHQGYSIFLSSLGRTKDASDEIHLAQELDPLSVPITTSAGWVAYFARRNDRAIEQCKNALDIEPNAANPHDCLGSAYLEKHMYPDAIRECRTALTLSEQDPDRAVCLGRAYVGTGESGKTHEMLRDLETAARQTHVPPYFLGVLHAALGEKDQAFTWLEQSYRERDPYLKWIKVSPALDTLRSDPRFEDLQRRLAFPSN